jgi:hypothetical protein
LTDSVFFSFILIFCLYFLGWRAVGAGSKPAHNEHNVQIERNAHNDIDVQMDNRVQCNRAGLEPAPTRLSEIVRQFKTFSAKKINQSRNLTGTPVWQRNYHEHIIRSECAYLNIAHYIETNPMKWQEDCYFEQ